MGSTYQRGLNIRLRRDPGIVSKLSAHVERAVQGTPCVQRHAPGIFQSHREGVARVVMNQHERRFERVKLAGLSDAPHAGAIRLDRIHEPHATDPRLASVGADEHGRADERRITALCGCAAIGQVDEQFYRCLGNLLSVARDLIGFASQSR